VPASDVTRIKINNWPRASVAAHKFTLMQSEKGQSSVQCHCFSRLSGAAGEKMTQQADCLVPVIPPYRLSADFAAAVQGKVSVCVECRRARSLQLILD